jgi:hypothetical protein
MTYKKTLSTLNDLLENEAYKRIINLIDNSFESFTSKEVEEIYNIISKKLVEKKEYYYLQIINEILTKTKSIKNMIKVEKKSTKITDYTDTCKPYTNYSNGKCGKPGKLYDGKSQINTWQLSEGLYMEEMSGCDVLGIPKGTIAMRDSCGKNRYFINPDARYAEDVIVGGVMRIGY